VILSMVLQWLQRGLFDLSPAGSMALELTDWNVLDLGTSDGLFLHALFKQEMYMLLC
jgi:predicted rRNA methylase YqxC with S4 and FtsJ domains